MSARFNTTFVLRVVAVLAIATTLAVVVLKPLATRTDNDAMVEKANPRSEALNRCHALGAQAIDDAACQTTWDDDRRRFLNSDKSENR